MSKTFPPLPPAGIPSGAVIKVQGNQPCPAGFSFLDSQVTNATEQGCSYYDAVAPMARAFDAGLTVLNNYDDGTALTGYGFSFSEPLLDPVEGDISSFGCNYDISADYTSAAVVSALFVPGSPSRLYFVLDAVKTSDGLQKIVVLSLTPDVPNSTFAIEMQAEVDCVADSVSLITAWGSSRQCAFVADSNAAPGAQVCAMRVGSVGLFGAAKWLLWDLGATLNLRVAAGDRTATADTLRINSPSVGRVLAYCHETKSFLAVAGIDSAIRSRVGVYYDAANDQMAATGVALLFGVVERTAVARAVPAQDGQPAHFMVYTKLGFHEVRHGTVVTDGFADVSVLQTSARHPFDSFNGAATGLSYTPDDSIVRLYFSGEFERHQLTCDYSALKAGFERKAVKD